MYEKGWKREWSPAVFQRWVLHNPYSRNHPKSPVQRRSPLATAVDLIPMCIWQTSQVQKLLSGVWGQTSSAKMVSRKKVWRQSFQNCTLGMPAEQWSYSDIWWKGGELGQSCEVYCLCRDRADLSLALVLNKAESSDLQILQDLWLFEWTVFHCCGPQEGLSAWVRCQTQTTSGYLWRPAHWQATFLDSKGLGSSRREIPKEVSWCQHGSSGTGSDPELMGSSWTDLTLLLGIRTPYSHHCVSAVEHFSEATKCWETKTDTGSLPISYLPYLLYQLLRCPYHPYPAIPVTPNQFVSRRCYMLSVWLSSELISLPGFQSTKYWHKMLRRRWDFAKGNEPR